MSRPRPDLAKATVPRPAALAALLIVIAALHPPSGIGVSLCPSGLLGTPCAGCGLTRSLSLAARAEFASSLALHPFGILVLAAACMGVVSPVLPARWTARPLQSICPHARLLGLLALAALLAFGAARAWGLWPV